MTNARAGCIGRPRPKVPAHRLGRMVRHLTLAQHADAYAKPPQTDDQDPATLVTAAVAEVLELAETWLGWDGRPVRREATPGRRTRRYVGSPTTCSTTSPRSSA